MSSSRTETLAPVPERVAPTPREFQAEILPSGRPMVVRSVARDWPLVIAALEDAHQAMSLLEAGANASVTSALRANPAEEGRFHYANDVQSFNFIRGKGDVADVLAELREQELNYRPFAIAAQALIAERYFPDSPSRIRCPSLLLRRSRASGSAMRRKWPLTTTPSIMWLLSQRDDAASHCSRHLRKLIFTWVRIIRRLRAPGSAWCM